MVEQNFIRFLSTSLWQRWRLSSLCQLQTEIQTLITLQQPQGRYPAPVFSAATKWTGSAGAPHTAEGLLSLWKNTLIQVKSPLRNGASHYIHIASPTLLLLQSASALSSAYGVIKCFSQLSARDMELLHLIERSSSNCSHRVHLH